MDYQDTLTYLYNSVPMFQQVGGSAYKEGLENILTSTHTSNIPTAVSAAFMWLVPMERFLLAYACRHTARGRIQGRALYLAPSGGFPGAHPD